MDGPNVRNDTFNSSNVLRAQFWLTCVLDDHISRQIICLDHRIISLEGRRQYSNEEIEMAVHEQSRMLDPVIYHFGILKLVPT